MVIHSVDEMELRRVRRSEKSYGYRIIAGQRLAYDVLKEINSHTRQGVLVKRHTSIQIAYLGEYEGCEEGLLLGWNEGGAEGTSLHDLGSDG